MKRKFKVITEDEYRRAVASLKEEMGIDMEEIFEGIDVDELLKKEKETKKKEKNK